MKLQLFKLDGDYRNYSSFLQTNYNELYESIHYKVLHEQKWIFFDMEKYVIPEFKLNNSDTGKKIFNMTYLQIPAPNAADASKDILESMGEFSPIKIPNKIEKL